MRFGWNRVAALAAMTALVTLLFSGRVPCNRPACTAAAAITVTRIGSDRLLLMGPHHPSLCAVER
jgi:hypothetical protein